MQKSALKGNENSPTFEREDTGDRKLLRNTIYDRFRKKSLTTRLSRIGQNAWRPDSWKVEIEIEANPQGV